MRGYGIAPSSNLLFAAYRYTYCRVSLYCIVLRYEVDDEMTLNKQNHAEAGFRKSSELINVKIIIVNNAGQKGMAAVSRVGHLDHLLGG